MKRRIRMVGFDLDGTLLTTDKRLTEYTKEILKKAIDKGVVVLPVTGRPLNGVPKEIADFPGIRYMITSNGARVVKDGKTIHENLLSVEKARKILDIFEDYDTLRDIYYDGQGYMPKAFIERVGEYVSSPAMAQYIVSTRVSVDDLRTKFEEENRKLDKIQALFNKKSEQEEAWKRVQALGDLEVTGALNMNIEVNAGGVHKGRALLWLAEELGIDREEVMAFGDGSNDLKMIEEAGIGVAMANAIPSVSDAADLAALSNDSDGVARIIEEYVLSMYE